MRRTGIAPIALATLAIALGASGSGALAISNGPLSASPDSISFLHVAQGTQKTITETLTNDSPTSTSLMISSDPLTGSNDFTIGTDNCNGAQLDPGNTCTVDIIFAPTSNGGENATLTINDDDSTDGQQQQTIDLGGTGVATQFSLSGPRDVGDQRVASTSGDQVETVTNNTDYSANPSGPSITGSGSGDFNVTGNNCSGSVAGLATCTINVNFAPTGLGSTSATLNAGGQSVTLTGNGVAPNASLTPPSFGFGSQPVATSATTTFTLQNTGTSPLNYGSTTEGGSNPGDFTENDAGCTGASLAPNATCPITVTFDPTTTGSRSATVTVHDDDPNNPTQTVTVTGNGTPSSVGFSPSSVTFVTPIPAGTASPVHTVTVSNTTNSNLPITGMSIVGANPKNFIKSADTCTGANLGPNQTCTIHVEFTPSAAGLRTALLQVRDTGPIAPHQHQVTLTGTGTYPHDPKRVRGSVGCASSRITWVSPTATRFAGTIVVRNHAHFPVNAGDGTVVRHPAGAAADTGLKHFTTYYYRVFAKYHSLTHAGGVNYSAGVRLKERTGEICTPQNGARISDLTPTFTWLRANTQNGYAFVLQHSGETIWINYTKQTQWHIPASWRYNKATHRLGHERSYAFYLYAYPSSHPKGILIGKVAFTTR